MGPRQHPRKRYRWGMDRRLRRRTTRQSPPLHPQPTLGQAEDLAGVLVYLASDSCSFTTGEPFFVDGGIMIRT